MTDVLVRNVTPSPLTFLVKSSDLYFKFISQSESDENSSTARLLKTVEEMKKEKVAERDKIRQLHEKIDDYVSL